MTGRSTTVLVTAALLLACGPGSGNGGSGGGKGGSGDSGGSGSGGGGGGGATTCSRVSCAGCCDGTTCEPGTEVTACGKDAAACQVCGAQQLCHADRTCGVDPERSWRIYVSAARISGSTVWDTDGSAPDVVITVYCPANGGPAVPSTEVESFTPTWPNGSCVLKASELMGAGIGWTVDDIDVIGSESITGFTTTTLTDADISAGQKVLGVTGGVNSLTFKLDPL
jgi:hypothetical protein